MRRLTLPFVSILVVAAGLLLSASAGASPSSPVKNSGSATTFGHCDEEYDRVATFYEGDCGPVGCEGAGLARIVIIDPCEDPGGEFPDFIEGPPGDPNCSDTVDNDFDGFTDGADPQCQDPDSGGVPPGGLLPDGDDPACLAAKAELALRQAAVDKARGAVEGADGQEAKEKAKRILKRKRAKRNTARDAMRELCNG